MISGVGLLGPGASPLSSQLLARTGICDVLHFQAGRCDLGFDHVAISTRSAHELGASLGSVINASVQGTKTPLRLKITGIYAVPNFSLSYWWGNAVSYFPFGVATSGSNRIPEIDSLIASPQTALDVPTKELPQLTGEVPLKPGGVGLGEESGVRRALSSATTTVARNGVMLSTQLPPLLAGADHQRHVMSTIVAIAAIQLVLLAVWVLAGLLVRSSDARQSEIRVARLRGFPPSSLLAVSAAEPASLCLVGMVLGIAGAWGAVVIARDRLLDPAATISTSVWVFAAFGVTLAAIVAALGIGTFRLLRSHGLSDVQAGSPAGARRRSLVTDTVLLVLSVVALVALGTSGNLSGHSNPIASAAPGLIALGAAVIGVHVVLLGCRLGLSASAYSDRVAVFLAMRQIVRRPAVMRQTRVLIIALCLACFAISAWSVGRSNRASAATFSVGSTEVATVTPHGVGLQQAVDRVDPHGRFAMAAATVKTASSNLLAVDAPRLTATGAWPRGISNTSLAETARRLDPSTAPEVTVPGAPVQVSASVLTRTNAAGLANLDLALWVANPQVGTAIVSLGALRSGHSLYRGSLASYCPGGCRLAGLGVIPALNRTPPSAGAVQLTLAGLATHSRAGAWKAVPADLTARGWRSTAAGIQVRPGAGGGLTFVVPLATVDSYTGALGFSNPPMASVADYPTMLPGAATTEVEQFNGGPVTSRTVPGQGLDGNTLDIAPSVSTSSLPQLGTDAVMVDLDLLSRAQTNPTSPYASDQVWLGPRAPADALTRLQAAGLRLDGVQRASAVFQRLQRSAPALADDFLLVATIVALLAAAASTLGVLGATTRQRATELTALEVGGVPRRALAGSLALESVVLAATALFGAAAGVLAAIMAIPSLPEVSTSAAVPLQYGVPGGLVAAVAAAVIAIVLLASAAVTAILIRRMSPLLLRLAPNDTAG